MLRVILLVALLASPALSEATPAKQGSANGAERRRAFYRRSTTTAAPAPAPSATHEDTASAETKFGGDGTGGEGLYTVGDSFTIGGGGGGGGGGSSSSGDSVGKGSSFKPVTSGGDKLTSFSEYNFGGTKLSDPGDSDEDYGLGGLKNHKPLTSSSNSFKTSGSFDFLNNDFSKTALDHSTRPKSSITSKFSISHPTPSRTSGIAGKLDHLDDSTEYDVYSSLKSSSSYRSPLQGYGTSQFSAFPGSSFDGKVKKLSPYGSFDDSGLTTGSLTTSGGQTKYKKNKLSLDDDTFGGGVGSTFGGFGNSFGVGKLEDLLGGGAGIGKKNPFRFGAGEPPLVNSALSTLKHFGHGILGKPEKASSLFDDSGESGTGFGASKFKPSSNFGKQGSFSNSFNLDDSDESYEPVYTKPKHPKPHHSSSFSSSSSSSFGSSKPLLKPSITEFDSDFDVKNIKLPGAHSITNSNSNSNKFRQHSTKSTLHKSKHGSSSSNIDNPNPLEFRPNFKLQDVPNLYPDEHAHHHLGAGIAAKGQIENFLNSEGVFKPEPFRTTHFLDGPPAKKNPYAQFAKPSEDDNLEKEALKAQIEFLKAQAAKRSPAEVRQRPQGGVPLGPPPPSKSIPGHGPIRGPPRPVRRIPALGVKSAHPLPRIPHYNDRPYSVSFKL